MTEPACPYPRGGATHTGRPPPHRDKLEISIATETYAPARRHEVRRRDAVDAVIAAVREEQRLLFARLSDTTEGDTDAA